MKVPRRRAVHGRGPKRSCSNRIRLQRQKVSHPSPVASENLHPCPEVRADDQDLRVPLLGKERDGKLLAGRTHAAIGRCERPTPVQITRRNVQRIQRPQGDYRMTCQLNGARALQHGAAQGKQREQLGIDISKSPSVGQQTGVTCEQITQSRRCNSPVRRSIAQLSYTLPCRIYETATSPVRSFSNASAFD